MEINRVPDLTEAQNELLIWLKKYIQEFKHSPSIRQMMQAMGLKHQRRFKKT